MPTKGKVRVFVQLGSIATSGVEAYASNLIETRRMFVKRSLEYHGLLTRRVQLYNNRSIHTQSISYTTLFCQIIYSNLVKKEREARVSFHPLERGGYPHAIFYEPENMWSVSLLTIEPTDSVLEIGFGAGATIQKIAASANEGYVAGVDFSHTMVRVALKRNSKAVKAGRVKLKYGNATSLPFEEAVFDKVLSIHSLYFWPDPLKAFCGTATRSQARRKCDANTFTARTMAWWR